MLDFTYADTLVLEDYMAHNNSAKAQKLASSHFENFTEIAFPGPVLNWWDRITCSSPTMGRSIPSLQALQAHAR